MEALSLEEAILGCIFLDNGVLDRIPYLATTDFKNKKCCLVFHAMLEMKENGQKIDLVLLHEKLDQQNKLVQVGGINYLMEISGSEYSTQNAEKYAIELRKKTVKRDAYKEATEFLRGIQAAPDMDKYVSRHVENLCEITSDSISSDYQTSKNVTKEAMLKIQERYEGTGVQIATGYPDLDRLISISKSSFIIIGARPSMGKTSLAMDIAQNIALQGPGVAIFSLETPNADLAIRRLAAASSIDTGILLRGKLHENHFPKLLSACNKMSELPFFYFDVSKISVPGMKAQCMKLKRELGLGLIVIDYLQLLVGRKKTENRTQEISAITRGIKLMGMELGVPIICLSQLNRELEKRSNKRPQLSDLRESGSIEQDADIVAFIYRPCIYEPGQEDNNVAEIIIAKNKNGPVGMCELLFEKQFTRFSSLAKEYGTRF